jgi:hypothetical protein
MLDKSNSLVKTFSEKQIKQDIHILRQAAFDIQLNSNDLVCIAGVVQRVKNWWKARFNPEFADKKDQVEQAYDDMKGPLSNLIQELQKLDTAFKSQDPDEVARLVSQVPGTIAQVTKDMSTLSTKMRAADAVIPTTYVDETGQEIAKDNIRWTTKGYKKNKDVVEQLLNMLPAQFKEIPIGKRINQPITQFSWFSNYSPNDIVISSNVYQMTRKILVEQLSKVIEPEAVETILNMGYEQFLENLKKSILENSILVQTNFPNISSSVTHRRANEMEIEVNAGPVLLPAGKAEIWIDVNKILFHDLGASVNPTKKLSVYLIRYVGLSNETYSRLMENRKKNIEIPKEAKNKSNSLVKTFSNLGIKC